MKSFLKSMSLETVFSLVVLVMIWAIVAVSAAIISPALSSLAVTFIILLSFAAAVIATMRIFKVMSNHLRIHSRERTANADASDVVDIASGVAGMLLSLIAIAGLSIVAFLTIFSWTSPLQFIDFDPTSSDVYNFSEYMLLLLIVLAVYVMSIAFLATGVYMMVCFEASPAKAKDIKQPAMHSEDNHYDYQESSKPKRHSPH